MVLGFLRDFPDHAVLCCSHLLDHVRPALGMAGFLGGFLVSGRLARCLLPNCVPALACHADPGEGLDLVVVLRRAKRCQEPVVGSIRPFWGRQRT